MFAKLLNVALCHRSASAHVVASMNRSGCCQPKSDNFWWVSHSPRRRAFPRRTATLGLSRGQPRHLQEQYNLQSLVALRLAPSAAAFPQITNVFNIDRRSVIINPSNGKISDHDSLARVLRHGP